MFSDYEKILILIDDNDDEIIDILNGLNDSVVILYKQSINNSISKFLFRKGIENINFICDTPISIINIGKPDLIITKIELDQQCINSCEKNNISIFNYKTKNSICGICKKTTNYLGFSKLLKICSPECEMSEHSGFYELLTKCNIDEIQSNLEKSFSNSKKDLGVFKDLDLDPQERKKIDKFQKIALLDAKRHAYQTRKNNYIRSMRSNSYAKDEIFDDTELKVKEVIPIKMCKAKTKKEGKPCSNKVLVGSEYCGIVSHRNMDPNPSNNVKKQISSKKFKKLMKL